MMVSTMVPASAIAEVTTERQEATKAQTNDEPATSEENAQDKGSQGQATATTPEGGNTPADAASPQNDNAPSATNDQEASTQEEPTDATKDGSTQDAPAKEDAAFEQSQTVDGVTVSVKANAGTFPKDATLSVSKVVAEEREKVDEAVGAKRDEHENVAAAFTFNIKVLGADGAELQPENGKRVDVSFALPQVADANLSTSVYHVEEKEDEDGLEAQKLNVKEDEKQKTVTANSDSFSYYTVEFTYDELVYVLAGNESVPLATILNAVGLKGDPQAATTSNSELFSVSKDSGEWVVTAHQAFDTKEWMKVTIANVEYMIEVTDSRGDVALTAQADAIPYVDAQGNPRTPIEALKITKNTGTLKALFYYVEGSVNKSDIEVNGFSGQVNIILCDGAELHTDGISIADGKRLRIWTQSHGEQQGKLYTSEYGIRVEKGRSLEINGGYIRADTSEEPGRAGIGGQWGDAGTITINNGDIRAWGTAGGAGIGGGTGGSGGTITINGGTVFAAADKFSSSGGIGSSGAGIGGGGGANTAVGKGCGNITINGGEVEAYGNTSSAGIGCGWKGFKPRNGLEDNIITINDGVVKAVGGPRGAGIGSGKNGSESAGRITINGGEVTAIGNQYAAGIGGGDESGSGIITITDGKVAAFGTKYGAGIGSGDNSDNKYGAHNEITISGGSVYAAGGQNGAGIGGGEDSPQGGHITISGGDVIAAGGSGGAGIGGGYRGKCSMVIIDGGLVKAQGGDNGAGIGSGNNTKCVYPDGGVRISGGTVASQGGTYGAGIGSGNNGDAGLENIEISGGSVNAIGQVNAAGIGGGGNSGCGTINITGGSVEAAGQQRGAGIGGGSGRAAAYIGISNAQVYAVGEFGAGIGTGGSTLGKKNAGRVSGNQIVIKDSTVLAASLAGGAGIGGGIHGDGGNIKISGGAVAALGGTSHLNTDGSYETYGIDQFKDYINTDKCSHVVKQVVETIGVKGLQESGQQGQQGQQGQRGTQSLQSQSTESPNRLVVQAIWDDAWDWISGAASDVWGGIKDTWGFLKDVTTWPFEHFDDAVDAIKDVVKWPYDHLDTIIDTINWPYYKVKSLFGEGSSFEEIYYTGAGIGGGYKGAGGTITIEDNALVDAQAGKSHNDGADGSMSSSIGMGKLGSAPTSALSTDVSIYQSAKVTYGALDRTPKDDANPDDRYHRDEDEAMYTSGRDPNVDYDVITYQYAVIEPGEIRLKVEKQWEPDNTTPAYPLLINYGVDYYAGDGSANKFVYGDFYLNEGSDWTGFVDVSSPPYLWLKETPLSNPTNNGVSWKTSWKLVYPKAGPQGGNPAEGIVDATVDAKDQKAWFDLREKPQGMSDEDYVAVKKSVVDGTAKIVLTNTRMKTYHVTKKWQGSDTNPSSIATVLQKKEVDAEGNETWKTVETITLPKDDKWEADFKPVEDLGDENYRVRELDPTSTDQNVIIVYDRSDNATQSGALKNTFTWENGGKQVQYDVSYVRENNKTTITNNANSYTLEIKKDWDVDLEKKDRPNSIEVAIQEKKGDTWEVVEVVELNSNNSWKQTRTLPKNHEGSNEKITYRVRELREETALQSLMNELKTSIMEPGQAQYNEWMGRLKTEGEAYWEELPQDIRDAANEGYESLLKELDATEQNLYNKLVEKLNFASAKTRIVYDKKDSDKSGDTNVVTYHVDAYTSALEGQVEAHVTKYKVSYSSKDGEVTIKNKAILDIDTIKRWIMPGVKDEDKPGHAWVVLMCKPKAGAKDNAGNLASAAGIDLGGVLDYEFPVIDPLEGGMDPISAISQMALGVDLGIFDSFLGDIIDIPDIAIAKVSKGNDWTKRFVVEKYAKGIPMEFKGAEATSEILKQVIKYFTGVDLPISFSLNGYFSIPTKAVSTPLGTTDLDLSKLTGNALAKAQSLTMQDLANFGTNTLLDGTHLMANVINVKIDWDNDSDSEPTKIKGTKTWADKDAQSTDENGQTVSGSDLRPNTLKIHIKGKDNKDIQGSPIELKKSDFQNKDTWDWQIELPNGVSKKDCSVSEEYPQDYTHKDDYLLSVDGFNLTNTWREDIIYGQKTWKDENNKYGIRPNSITVHLFAQVEGGQKQEVQVKTQPTNGDTTSGSGGESGGGQESGTTSGLTVTEQSGWKWFFCAPRTDEHGKQITYTLEEDPVEGYTSQIDGFNVTNEYDPTKDHVVVKKVWEDEDDFDKVRPESVRVQLKKGDQNVGEPVTLSNDNKWTHAFAGLEHLAEGESYSVDEVDVPDGYTKSVTGDATECFTITNTHEVQKTEVKVAKVWEDDNNRDGIRPDSVTVKLLKNGQEAGETLTLDEDNDWSGTFENLLTKQDGADIKYAISEIGVEGYETTTAGNAKDGYTITNKHTPETTAVKVAKKWDDNNNQAGNRPSSVEFKLQADGEAAGGKTVTEGMGWQYTFEGLPKYKDGKAIVYTVTENTVKDYVTSIAGDATVGFTVTNTYKPNKTQVNVRKVWKDNNNQDGKRPQGVTVHLHANGENTNKTLTLSEGNNWAGAFEDLDANGEDNAAIEYSVSEDEVVGYEAKTEGNAREGFTITNTHESEVVDVRGAKTWANDNDNQSNTRPQNITIRLRANGEEVDSTTASPSNGWKWTFNNVPKYKDGKEISYTITEDAGENYTSAVNGYNVTNTYTANKTQVSVTKVWDDGDDQDGMRPDSVTVKLLANGTAVDGKTLELNASNKWTGTFNELDASNGGTPITYTVEENAVPTNYEATVSGNAAQGFTITNKHTPETTTVSGTKTWASDDDNQNNTRPQSIVIRLHANGREVASTTATAQNNWAWRFDNLPKKEAGSGISYTVTEDAVEGYTTQINGYAITNTYNPEKTQVDVHKVWDDANNQDGARTGTVVACLYADGQSTNQTRELNQDNGWSATFDNLDKNKDGKAIVYTVQEDSVPVGYSASVTGDAARGFSLVNVHVPGTVTVSGSKTWDDANDQDGIRPKRITVLLKANGKEIARTTTSEANEWKWEFANLPKFQNGSAIAYTVDEETNDVITGTDGPGTYKVLPVEGDAAQGFTIANTHTPETVTPTVNKVWDDDENRDGIRPAEVTVHLMKCEGDNKSEVASKKITANGTGWFCAFDSQPKYEAGKEIVYTVTESAVAGYETTVSGNATSGFTVTNTHTPDTTQVRVSKAWDDNNDQDGKRPDSVTVKLLANGVEAQGKTLELKSGNSWSGAFEDLPVNQDGAAIAYTVEEQTTDVITDTDGPGTYKVLPVEGDVDRGFTITNKHTPETITVEGTKTWNDEGHGPDTRPDSITIRLHANGREVENGTRTIAKSDASQNWKFENLPKYEAGEEIAYTITEDAVPNYTTAVNGYNVTNMYEPGKTQVTVHKVWDDDNDRDHIRSGSVTVNLLADGTAVDGKTLTLDASNKWTGTFTDLDVDKDGTPIAYTVEEQTNGVVSDTDGPGTYEVLPVEGSATQGFTITNKHTPETTHLTVHKVWDDDNDRDGLRGPVRLVLTANGKSTAEPQTVSEVDDWTYTFENLPVKENGQAIVYSVREEHNAVFNMTITRSSATDTEITVTNKHTPETTTVAGKKIWNDNNNANGTRPESVVIRLYANGKETQSKRVTAEDDWSWEFKDLYKNEDGKEIVYTISEDAVENYTSEVNGFDVVNTYTPGKTSINVSKIWSDDNDRDGIRPKAVTVRLLANGQSTNKALRLSEVDGWTGSFTDLDTEANGNPITYTVAEEEVAGYKTSTGGDAARGFVVNNVHTPEAVSVPVYKAWNDNYNADNTRPASVEVYLFANGKKVAGKTLTSTSSWQCIFVTDNSGAHLPKYEDGKEIVYTVSEEPVNNYSATIGGNAQKGFTITNTLTPNKTSLSVRKIWKDDYNRDGMRPDSITVHLLDNSVDTGKTLVLDEDNGWSGAFTELEQGNNERYSVREDAVAGYFEPSYSQSEGLKEGFTITNEHSTAKTQVPVIKVWDDSNDAAGARPESVTVRLYANGREIDSQEVTNNATEQRPNVWWQTFTDQPKYENGKEIVYTVSEDVVPGYIATYSSQTSQDYTDGTLERIITNKYDPTKTQVTVHQVWADYDDQDGLRPQDREVYLYRNGVRQDGKKVTISPSTEWSEAFTNLPMQDERGDAYSYTVLEDPEPAQYSTYYYGYAKRGYTIVSEHEPDTVTVRGAKVWEDQGNLDGSRPASVTVRLTAKDKETNEVKLKKTAEVAGSNNTNTWDWSFAGLPKKIDGKEVEYSVGEDPVVGYDSKITGDATDGFTITNTHVPNTTLVTGTKVWDDYDDQDGKRPDHATIILYANGSMTAQTEATETSDGTWRWAFNNLPTTNAGEPIEYTIGEEQVKGYEEPVITGDATNGYVVTNKRVPEKITISGSKVWDDNNNAEGMRPSEITVRLVKNDGQIEVASKKVTAADDWKWSFTDLPWSEGGEIIDYNIVEDPVKGYEATITGALTEGVTITNSPEKVRISGTKVWNDNNNQEGKRPTQITVHLMKGEGANQKEVEKKTVTEEDNWDWEFADQLKYEAGKEVAYTVTEDAVEGYESAVTGDVAKGFIVTNTYGSSVPNPNTQKFSITYKLNGGTYKGSTDDIVEAYEVGTVISVHEAPTREGYTFDYWKGSKYQPGDEYTVTEDHTFEAQWKKNGGTPDDDSPDDDTTSDASGNTASQGSSSASTRTATAKTADASASPLAFAAIGLAVLAIARRRRRE